MIHSVLATFFRKVITQGNRHTVVIILTCVIFLAFLVAALLPLFF